MNIFSNLKIREILFIGALVVSIIPALLIGGANYFATSDIIKERSLEEKQDALSELTQEFTMMTEDISAVVMSLSKSESIVSYELIPLESESQGKDGDDEQDDDEDALFVNSTSVSAIENDIALVGRNKSDLIERIAFVDMSGTEVVSVLFPRSQMPEIDTRVGENFGEYISDVSDLEMNEAYVSAIDLKRENGEIVEPHEPVIHILTPVFSQENERLGAVIATVELQNFLLRLQTNAKNKFSGSQLILVRPSGSIIFHPDAQKSFGSILGSSETIFDSVPSLVGVGMDSSVLGSVDVADQEELYVWKRVNNFGGDESVVAILKTGKSSLLFDLEKLQQILVLLASISALGVLVIASIISGVIVRPISNFIEILDEIRKGNFKKKIDEKYLRQRSEIGDLSRAFQAMLTAVKESRAEIDKKVEGQTKEITKQKNELSEQYKVIFNVLKDVDESKRKIKITKQKIEAILENIGEGVIATDDQGQVILVNSVASKMLGTGESQMLGKKIYDVVPIKNDDGEIVPVEKRPVLRVLGKDETVAITASSAEKCYFVRSDGTDFPVAITATPFAFEESGKRKGMIAVFRDITKQKQIDRAKTEFVSLASHQLRTPLSAINWFTQILRKKQENLNDSQKMYLEEIDKGGKRMDDLVSMLLNTSRMDLGTFAIKPTPVDFREVVESLLGELGHKIETKKLNINKEFDTIPTIKTDGNLIRIVFQNLLSNAVKYTPEGGRVTVKLQDTKGAIKAEIIDTGLGIPEAEQSKLFEKFFRAGNVQNAQIEGNGLGMYIVKSIVDVMHGTIAFKSKENKGTTFFVTFPKIDLEEKDGVAMG